MHICSAYYRQGHGRRQTDNERKGIGAHLVLTDVTMKAMYDDAVDFSSPERHLGTIVQRLPEYLGLDNG